MRRTVRLAAGCVIVGVGVGLVLRARLGSDGYSTAIYGLSRQSGLAYAPTNWIVGAACVGLSWARGVRPAAATIVHPLVVGAVIDLVLVFGSAGAWFTRVATLAAGTLILAVGVAVYLGAGLGSGPFESLVLALRPIPFRPAFVLLQAVGVLVGLLLRAPVGPGSLVIVFCVGPLVALVRRRRPPPVPRRGR